MDYFHSVGILLGLAWGYKPHHKHLSSASSFIVATFGKPFSSIQEFYHWQQVLIFGQSFVTPLLN